MGLVLRREQLGRFHWLFAALFDWPVSLVKLSVARNPGLRHEPTREFEIISKSCLVAVRPCQKNLWGDDDVKDLFLMFMWC